ncbi:MAG: metal-dependent hydrolase [Pseudomonadota bacterium]|nr:metal-dependent hydrolase [Pseudomonadota bacterium]
MANFSAHLYGGAAASSVGSLAVYALGWAGPEQTQLLFFLGVTGSLLPDIDADNSAPVRGFFTLLGVVVAFLASFTLVGLFPVLELALIWGGVFLFVRYCVFEAFARFTVHRGVWHSWLAALLVAMATADAAYHLFRMSAWESWLCGVFVFLGYLTHLCLDEIASVDLLNNRIKRSFGTALKPFSTSAPGASLAMLAAVIALAYPAPSLQPVLEAGAGYGLSMDTLQAKILGNTGWLSGLREALN